MSLCTFLYQNVNTKPWEKCWLRRIYTVVRDSVIVHCLLLPHLLYKLSLCGRMWVSVQHEPYLTCPSVCWCVSLHCYACLVQMQSDILQYWIYFVDFYFACVTHFNYFSCFIAITTRVWCYHLLLLSCFIETPNTQWYREISDVLYSWI